MSRQSMERQKQVETLTAANRVLAGECQRLQAENRDLRAVLRFYADLANWSNSAGNVVPSPVTYDSGDRARAALQNAQGASCVPRIGEKAGEGD